MPKFDETLDQRAQPVRVVKGTATQTNATVTTSSTVVDTANTARVEVLFQNVGTVDCWISFNGPAVVGQCFLILAGGDTWSGNCPQTDVTAITASGSTTLIVLKVTAA